MRPLERPLEDAAAVVVDDPQVDVLPVREERPVEEALQTMLQESRRVRHRKRHSGPAAGGADVHGLGPSGERLAAKQSHVPPAGLSAKVDEEAASEGARRHMGETRDRRGVVAAAGRDGGEDDETGEAQSHDRRIR
jgi:hypothetical protein